jgi:hypothetical protein
MAKLADGDAGKEVEIFVSAVIPERASGTLNEESRLSIVGVNQKIVVKRLDSVVFKHRGIRAARVERVRMLIKRGSPRAQNPASGEIP